MTRVSEYCCSAMPRIMDLEWCSRTSWKMVLNDLWDLHPEPWTLRKRTTHNSIRREQQWCRSFEIITDHKPLVSLFGELKQVPTTASPRIQWWAVTMCGYEYNIHYKAGKSHNKADCLSRLPLPVTVKSEPEEHVLLIEELDCSPVRAEQISRYTGRDPTLAHVREYLMFCW